MTHAIEAHCVKPGVLVISALGNRSGSCHFLLVQVGKKKRGGKSQRWRIEMEPVSDRPDLRTS